MPFDYAHTRPVRVCVTGAECTGKTTLARALGEVLGAPVIYESVRDYFEQKVHLGDANVYAADVIWAVEMQVRTEDTAPRNVPILVLDTDVFTISVWHERYVGHRFAQIDDLVKHRQETERRIDLYVLTSPDIRFVHDGVRGSEENRSQMHEVFKEALESGGRRYVQVAGTLEERRDQAFDAVVEFLAEESARLTQHLTAI